MLRLFVSSLVLLCIVEAGSPRVAISATPTEAKEILLDLTLSEVDFASVKDVVIYYKVNGQQGAGKAAPIDGSWKVQVHLKQGHNLISAHATYNDVKNVYHKTHVSGLDMTLNHGKKMEIGQGSRIPSRQIRASTIFRDDFNSFNGGDWQHVVSMYGGYNGEFQVYTNDAKNVFARSGKLYLKPTLTVDDSRFSENDLHWGSMDMNYLYGTCTDSGNNGCHREGKDGMLPPIMSGRLNSRATMKYGTVEIRAQIPQGDWLWPAIWMLPKHSVYGQWPRSGEIDIMESRGNQGNLGVGTISSTLHWGPNAGNNKFMKTNAEKHNYQSHRNWHADFHTWKLEWTPDHIITWVDNQEILRVDPGSNFCNYGGIGGDCPWWGKEKMAPFDQEFHMILNNAVGGTSGFFPDGLSYNGVNKPWWNGSPRASEDFWNARGQWLPTWQSQGDGVSLIIDWIEMKTL